MGAVATVGFVAAGWDLNGVAVDRLYLVRRCVGISCSTNCGSVNRVGGFGHVEVWCP